MSQIEFIYKGVPIVIYGEMKETMKDIMEKFITKSEGSKNNLVFLYGGNKIDEKLTFDEQANDIDKSRNKMSIIVVDYNEAEEIINKKKSKNIICPECYQNIRIQISPQKISIYDCRNKHCRDYTSLEEFEKTQYIDESKIICDDCNKQNKNNSYEHKFYICCNCKVNLCPLCKNKHDNSHDFIDYDIKNYYCDTHYDIYNLYCNDCKKDICTLCEKEHSKHKLTTYGSIMPDLNIAKDELENMKKTINETKNDINDIIEQLKNYMNNLDNYYKISNYIIQNYESKKRNYSSLQNINDIIDFMKQFNNDFSEFNIKNKFNNLMDTLIYKNNNNTKNENSEFKIDDNELKEKNEEIIQKEKNTPKDENKETEDKDVKNTEEKENNIENNKEEANEYNTEDKFENFTIESLKEDKNFDTGYNIKKMIVLQDQRILIYHNYKDENEKYRHILCIFDIKNNFTCDFSYEVESLKEIFQMENGNIILSESNKITIFKLNKTSFEILQEIEENIYKIFKQNEESIIVLQSNGEYIFYSYEKEIIYANKTKTIVGGVYDLCNVGKDEIAIYYYKEGKLYGYNAFLLFYDTQYYCIDKTLKLGDGEDGNLLKLVNKNTLLLDRNKRIVIVDVNNRIVKKEIKIDYTVKEIIPINNNKCIIKKYGQMVEYEIDNYNLKEKERKSVKISNIMKYPGNKLIGVNEENIIIYRSDKIHKHYRCDGCSMKPIIGKMFVCETCENYDYCEECYEKNKESHGHNFKVYY